MFEDIKLLVAWDSVVELAYISEATNQVGFISISNELQYIHMTRIELGVL